MSQTKLELAAELLANALESDEQGRQVFKGVLAMTIQDQLEKVADDNGRVTLEEEEIISLAYSAAEDFILTIENQNDED